MVEEIKADFTKAKIHSSKEIFKRIISSKDLIKTLAISIKTTIKIKIAEIINKTVETINKIAVDIIVAVEIIVFKAVGINQVNIQLLQSNSKIRKQ